MKTRIVHTKMWKDDYFGSLKPTEKLLFIYYLTCERVNILHCFEVPEREITFDTGLDLKAIEAIKQKFQADHRIFFYKKYVYLCNASRYEKYTGESNEKAQKDIIQAMPPDVAEWFLQVSTDLCTPVVEETDTPVTPLSEGSDTPQTGAINKKQEVRNKNEDESVREGTAHRLLTRFNLKMKKNYQLTEARKTHIRARLKTFSAEQLETAVDNLATRAFYRGDNDRKWSADPDFLFRSDEQVDKFLNMGTSQTPDKEKIFISQMIEEAHATAV